MPPKDAGVRLTPADIELLRNWINAGAPFPPNSQRTFVPEISVLKAIWYNLSLTPLEDRTYVRYFTITHLHNNPAFTEGDLALARAGFVKLINSVSGSSRLVHPLIIPVPEEGNQSGGIVFRLNMKDFHWNLDVWRKLISSYPYGLVPRDPEKRTIYDNMRELWTPEKWDGFCHVRADWFVTTASRGDAYHSLLELPKTVGELEKRLGVNHVRDFDQDSLRRAGFAGSGVSRHNRLIDRHQPTLAKYYYRSYDFGQSARRSVLYRFPLGPQRNGHPFADHAFEENGGEIIWSLANGLQGYFVVDKTGKRIDEAPIQIVRDLTEISGSPVVVNGISCIGCHRDGLHSYRDSTRRWSAVGGADAQKKVDRLFSPPEVLETLIEEDRALFTRAVEQLLRPYLNLGENAQKKMSDFPEPVAAMARFYYQDLTRAEVAYELGFSGPNLLPLENNDALRRLGLLPLTAGGKIPRDMWDTQAETPSTLFHRAANALNLGFGIKP